VCTGGIRLPKRLRFDLDVSLYYVILAVTIWMGPGFGGAPGMGEVEVIKRIKLKTRDDKSSGLL
jgi:hypothetical protein